MDQEGQIDQGEDTHEHAAAPVPGQEQDGRAAAQKGQEQQHEDGPDNAVRVMEPVHTFSQDEIKQVHCEISFLCRLTRRAFAPRFYYTTPGRAWKGRGAHGRFLCWMLSKKSFDVVSLIYFTKVSACVIVYHDTEVPRPRPGRPAGFLRRKCEV